MAKPPASGAKEAPKTKQSTLMGFFGKPKAGPTPRTASNSSLTAAASKGPATSPSASVAPILAPAVNHKSASTSRPASSAAGSSPTLVDRVHDGSAGYKRQPSPLAGGKEGEESDLSTPPSSPRRMNANGTKKEQAHAGDVDMDNDAGHPPSSPIVTGRRTKRKVIYAESDVTDDDDMVKQGPSRPRKSLKASSDDEFDFDDADDAAFEEFEAHTADSPSPSVHSESPPPRKKAPAKKSSALVAPKIIARPPPRPLPSNSNSAQHAQGSASGSHADRFLTQAEQRKLQEKEAKSQNDEIFSFLRNPLDGQKRPQDHPDYDKRTLYIPPRAFDELKPFEKQFWRIKKDNFDTVLFFQKGKFFELYEDDALIGHQEFDLKLTDRVRMKMVGVPEQSFDFWASKFLAAGYKVGRVDQAETAIGAEMRKAGTSKTNPKAKGKKATAEEEEIDDGSGDKIVRRELKQVFTNGTIVDGVYLTSDEANYCVSIKEYQSEGRPSAFGICTVDASTGQFNLTAFADDVVCTKLETMFRQIRPKELIYAKGNLSANTQRILRNTLPGNAIWQSFRPDIEFYTADKALETLAEIYETEDDAPGSKAAGELPEAIEQMLDNPLAMEALGGMLFYLRCLNLDKDLVTQRNFNVYDPIREGRNLVLDGQTLGHMEVLINNEGGSEGTLLELMQRCTTPFGKRLFRIWLTCPLRDIETINARLDAVDDLIKEPSFSGSFTRFAKDLPDLERLISRIHAGSVKQSEFWGVFQAFQTVQRALTELSTSCERFSSAAVANLLRSAPDLQALNDHMDSMFDRRQDDSGKTMVLEPRRGADPECDEADDEVEEIEGQLEEIRVQVAKQLKSKDVVYWHSAQGGKEIFQLQIPAGIKVPQSWLKQSSTKKHERYYTPDTTPVIRQLQEARERQSATKRFFFLRLLEEFDKDRTTWLQAVKVISELDCLVSLAKTSSSLDEPRCRPTFVESESAFVDFEELRHPSMCLRSNFIPNDVQLGGPADEARQILLTGPNMAGKSTLLRMTAAGIIMAQMGCYVPAAKATIAPVDRIQTRMGAYDNMFASASTFKVELDECSKILQQAGPRSFVILDELGRGTSTYDGMAIAGAVLHHLATHTLPLGFFATHYGSLTDDFSYHPNVRKMHMQTQVDDELMEVVFLYKLIPGVAESSHGTHVARLAGVSMDVVKRADQISAEFFDAFKAKLASKRRSALPLVALSDFTWLLRVASGAHQAGQDDGMAVDEAAPQAALPVARQMGLIRRAVDSYETDNPVVHV